MMKNFSWKWQDSAAVVLGLISLSYALINYNELPPQLPAQFGITGEVNKYWDKGSLIGVMGAMGIVLPLLLQLTRSIDPKSENYRKFENAYGMIRLAIAVLFDTALVLSVSHGLNQDIPAGKILIAVLGLMFMVIGNFMPQVRHNYFLGIRTPWTLANPEVWRRTHRFSGLMWSSAGLMFVIGAFLPGVWGPTVLLAGLMAGIILPLVYSWFISKR